MTQTKTLNPVQLREKLKAVEGIRVGSFIRKSLTDETPVGVTVHAPSSIRKEVFTKPMMETYCQVHGLTLIDQYPCTDAMQVYF